MMTMNATVSNFFSRESSLKRQSRTKPRKAGVTKSTLQIIPEEEESPRPSCSSSSSSYYASSSRSPSPFSGLDKSRRRHVQLTGLDIRLAKEQLSDRGDLLSTPPRRAPKPPSPSSSPDPFKLSFTDASYTFPHPPATPGSPCSSTSPFSSPESTSCGLPMTPPSSDDDFFMSPLASVRPLSVHKHNSCLPEFNPPSPASSGSLYPDEEDSDSDWYANEVSQILTLCSPIPPTLGGDVRPDSLQLPPKPAALLARRVSRPLPVPPVAMPSAQLDPAYPRPSPLPNVSLNRPPHLSLKASRPPPRSSIPSDFEVEEDILEYYSSQTSSSSSSPGSDLEEFDVEFDLDLNLRLPLSLPSSPIDLDAGLQELRARQAFGQTHAPAPSVPPRCPASPASSNWSFSPSLTPSDASDVDVEIDPAGRVLRSKWSSSTLASVHSAHAGPLSPRVFKFLTSSMSMSGKRGSHIKKVYVTPATPTKRRNSSRRDSELKMSVYESPVSSAGVKRRGSTSTMSSTSTSGSEGLRRKPIPIEMFLRA